MIDQSAETADLRQAFRERRTGDPRPGECPPAGRIEAAALDRCDPAEFNEILDHTAACPACAASWRIALALNEQEEKIVRPSAFKRSAFTRWASLAAAAVLVVAVGVTVLPKLLQQPAEKVYRSTETTGIRSLFEDGAAVPRDRLVLRWESGLKDAVYSVQVLDRDLNLLASGEYLKECEFQVPTDLLAGLPPGAVVLWRVEALATDGRPVHSPTFSVTLE